MKILLEHEKTAKRITMEDINMKTLLSTISKELNVDENCFKIQIFDKEFETYCDLESIDEVVNLCRLKIVDLSDVSSPIIVTQPALEENFASTSKNLRSKVWSYGSNFKFSINSYSMISREELKCAQQVYESTEKLHKPSYRLKSETMSVLSKELMEYGLYPTNHMYTEIVNSVLKAFPFLRDPLDDGSGAWKIALKYKMQEVRRQQGSSNETSVNSGKQPRHKKNPPFTEKRVSPLHNKGIKKARRGEINYAPNFADGENESTLRQHQEQMNKEWMKRDPKKDMINHKMEVTFALRRMQVISRVRVSEIKEQWPALFTPEQLYKEMVRLVGFDIQQRIKKNLSNEALVEILQKKMKTKNLTEDTILQFVPKLFHDDWSFFITEDDLNPQSCSLFSEDIVEQEPLPPHPTIIQAAGQWTIQAEGAILLDKLDFYEAVVCLLCIYYACDVQYHISGTKSMLFLQVGLAEIPSCRKLVPSVSKLISEMKRKNCLM